MCVKSYPRGYAHEEPYEFYTEARMLARFRNLDRRVFVWRDSEGGKHSVVNDLFVATDCGSIDSEGGT